MLFYWNWNRISTQIVQTNNADAYFSKNPPNRVRWSNYHEIIQISVFRSTEKYFETKKNIFIVLSYKARIVLTQNALENSIVSSDSEE